MDTSEPRLDLRLQEVCAARGVRSIRQLSLLLDTKWATANDLWTNQYGRIARGMLATLCYKLDVAPSSLLHVAMPGGGEPSPIQLREGLYPQPIALSLNFRGVAEARFQITSLDEFRTRARLTWPTGALFWLDQMVFIDRVVFGRVLALLGGNAYIDEIVTFTPASLVSGDGTQTQRAGLAA